MRKFIERSIAERTIRTLLDAGYIITVNDGEENVLHNSTDFDKILSVMFTTDEEVLVVKKNGQSSWVQFFWGNGEDVLADHGTSLEEVLKPVFDWIDENS